MFWGMLPFLIHFTDIRVVTFTYDYFDGIIIFSIACKS